ncbi:hypothetical protein EVAR_64328_1 [Eumeta japonica]|uniref:Uncharacterized protein n=1 Tax=Eumeta variegata TaxID=151549 RepID=A0A4C1ZDG9_EUMVA|nr:hypothetical protein EVAR_64328_1 [Eumeta japonica]
MSFTSELYQTCMQFSTIEILQKADHVTQTSSALTPVGPPTADGSRSGAVGTWYALCSGLQRQRLQAQQNIALRLIAGAGWYVKNDVIARDLGVETIEEFVRMLTRRAFNRTDAGPHPSLHNLAPHLDRPTRGYQLPRDLVTETPDI